MTPSQIKSAADLKLWMATTPHLKPATELPNWSVADLAKATGFSRNYVNQMVSGKCPVSPSFIAKLERYSIKRR